MSRINGISFKFFLVLIIIGLFSFYGKSQNKSNWSVNWSYPKVFIENKGQFDGRDKLKDSEIIYGIDQSSVQIFFTKQGLTYFLNTKVKNINRKKFDTTQPKRLIVSDFIHMTWEDANPNPEIVPEDMASAYQTYSMLSKDRKSYYDIRNIRGYKKITYKNLYPNIDVEYTFHPESGIKYSLILHPGADISKVKMKYTTDSTINIDNEGNVRLATIYGDIIDHAPVSYYKGNKNIVPSKFLLDKQTVSFILNNYNNSKSIIIDPWVVTPSNLPNSNCVWELDKDAAGNIYIIGGEMPMKLQKFNSSGVLQWTYSTPWDTNNNWLGTLTTDQNGFSYITSGSVAAIQKINSAGSMVWAANGGAFDEYWMISFNCDQTKLIVGGTRLGLDMHGVIFDISTTNGSVLSLVNVAKTKTILIASYPNEVRALTSSRDAKYYFLTLDSLGAINQNMTLCSTNGPVFKTISNYEFSYKCENYRPNNGNAGIRSIRANDNYVYSQNGTTIEQRSLVDGSIITSAAIPGGITTTEPLTATHQPGNSGIAVDDCGNVYVGSADRVIKYDANLNLLAQTNLPFAVYDVVVAPGGNVVVCGGTGTSSSTSRSGYIQSINMSACDPFQLICCNTTMCPAGPFCPTDPPYQIICEAPGGTWSGPGVDPVTGIFDPAVAGPGLHTITYTFPCGSSSINILVNTCVPLDICQELNGDMSVTNGTGPYTWQEYTPASTFPITNQAECVSCGYTWTPLVDICMNGIIPADNCIVPAGWSTFATGVTVTPSGTWPVKVVDANGDSAIIYDFNSLPVCEPCPTFSINISGIINACANGSNGSFSVVTSNGTDPYDYDLLLGTTPVANLTNVTGSQTFTDLAAGTYTLNVTDADNCTGTLDVTIGSTPNLTPIITGPDTLCDGTPATLDAGAGYLTYLWSTGDNTQTITITTSGTYSVSVTDQNCSGSSDITIAQGAALTPVITGQTQICPGASTILDAGAGYAGYSWSNGGSSQSTSVNAAGTYSVTVTDINGCSGSTNTTVTNITTLPVTVTSDTNTICPGNPVTITATGGGTYLWNTTPPEYDSVIVVHPMTSNTYVVTVTYNGCDNIGSITITVDPTLIVNTTSTNAGCAFDDGTATADLNGPGFTYVWNTNPPQYTQTATGLAEGTYTVTVGYNGCVGVGIADVGKEPGPEAIFYTFPQIPVQDGDPVLFFDESLGNVLHWAWDFGDSTQATGYHAMHTYADTGNFLVTLIITDDEGCKDTARKYIYINPLFTVWIPNSFTPNDDNTVEAPENEIFKPVGVGWDTKNYLMIIYDRWGREIFSTTDVNEGWNGTDHNRYGTNKAVQDIYVYLIQISDLSGIIHEYKGIIVLIQ